MIKIKSFYELRIKNMIKQSTFWEIESFEDTPQVQTEDD